MSKLCRWGILGAANIARKNWHSIWNSGNGVLQAVASRSDQRAEQFIEDCQTRVPYAVRPKACTYEAMLANPEIDALYIPLPTGIRKEWVIRAAEAGKHVLCEKPCAINAADLAEMLAACKQANVQFMDGVMYMHCGRLPALRAVLDDGTSVGQMRRITSQFSFAAPSEFFEGNIRASQSLEPLGCLGDLGWYNIRFSLWAMKYAMPERVSGRLITSIPHGDGPGTPTEFSGELFFAGGVSAAFYCSFITQNQQWANISGTLGYAHLRDFVLPFHGPEAAFDVTQAQFGVDGCRFDMADHTRRVAVKEFSNNARDSQETSLFRNFASLVLRGKPDPFWADIALQTQKVMDACLASSRQEGKLIAVQ